MVRRWVERSHLHRRFLPSSDRLAAPVRIGEEGGDRVDLESTHPHQKNHQCLVPSTEKSEVMGWTNCAQAWADIADRGRRCRGACYEIGTCNA